jgi:single-stranded-DNA-specific exonuclease
MAAGLTLRASALDAFALAFEQAVCESADDACFAQALHTDGALEAHELDLALVDTLERGVWGQGFPAPVFCDEVDVLSQRLVKDRHMKLALRVRGRPLAAIAFGRAQPLPARARIAYRVSRNDWNGLAELQLVVDAVE